MSLRNKLVSFSASVMHFFEGYARFHQGHGLLYPVFGVIASACDHERVSKMAKYLEIKEMDKVLLEVTVRASRNEKAFDVYDRNVYLSIHNHEDKIVYGGMPEGFPQERPHFGEGPPIY